jgi:predicted metal-dependent peptidase
MVTISLTRGVGDFAAVRRRTRDILMVILSQRTAQKKRAVEMRYHR